MRFGRILTLAVAWLFVPDPSSVLAQSTLRIVDVDSPIESAPSKAKTSPIESKTGTELKIAARSATTAEPPSTRRAIAEPLLSNMALRPSPPDHANQVMDGGVDIVFRSVETGQPESRPETRPTDEPGSNSMRLVVEPAAAPPAAETAKKANSILFAATELSFPATSPSVTDDPATNVSQVVQRLPKAIQTESLPPALFDREVRTASYDTRSRAFISRPHRQNPTQRPVAQIAAEPVIEPMAESPVESPAGADASLGPFEVAPCDGELRVALQRSKTLRSNSKVVGSKVVDPSICEVAQLSSGDVCIAGKVEGTTHVTFWFDDPTRQSITLLVQVERDETLEQEPPRQEPLRQVEQSRRELLGEVIDELFPNSRVKIEAAEGRWLVQGEASDASEAAQILAVVRDQASLRRGVVEDGTPQIPRVVSMLRVPELPGPGR